jgi:hypothetical protein
VRSGDFFIFGRPPLEYSTVKEEMILEELKKLILINEWRLELVGVRSNHWQGKRELAREEEDSGSGREVIKGLT